MSILTPIKYIFIAIFVVLYVVATLIFSIISKIFNSLKIIFGFKNSKPNPPIKTSNQNVNSVQQENHQTDISRSNSDNIDHRQNTVNENRSYLLDDTTTSNRINTNVINMLERSRRISQQALRSQPTQIDNNDPSVNNNEAVSPDMANLNRAIYNSIMNNPNTPVFPPNNQDNMIGRNNSANMPTNVTQRAFPLNRTNNNWPTMSNNRFVSDARTPVLPLNQNNMIVRNNSVNTPTNVTQRAFPLNRMNNNWHVVDNNSVESLVEILSDQYENDFTVELIIIRIANNLNISLVNTNTKDKLKELYQKLGSDQSEYRDFVGTIIELREGPDFNPYNSFDNVSMFNVASTPNNNMSHPNFTNVSNAASNIRSFSRPIINNGSEVNEIEIILKNISKIFKTDENSKDFIPIENVVIDKRTSSFSSAHKAGGHAKDLFCGPDNKKEDYVKKCYEIILKDFEELQKAFKKLKNNNIEKNSFIKNIDNFKVNFECPVSLCFAWEDNSKVVIGEDFHLYSLNNLQEMVSENLLKYLIDPGKNVCSLKELPEIKFPDDLENNLTRLEELTESFFEHKKKSASR